MPFGQDCLSEGQTARAANSLLITAESIVLAANPQTNLTNGLAGSRMLAERTRYTQFTDVEQEVNGLMTYDRKPKFDVAKVKALNDSLQ